MPRKGVFPAPGATQLGFQCPATRKRKDVDTATGCQASGSVLQVSALLSPPGAGFASVTWLCSSACMKQCMEFSSKYTVSPAVNTIQLAQVAGRRARSSRSPRRRGPHPAVRPSRGPRRGAAAGSASRRPRRSPPPSSRTSEEGRWWLERFRIFLSQWQCLFMIIIRKSCVRSWTGRVLACLKVRRQ